MATRLLESGSSRLIETAGTSVRLLEFLGVDVQPYLLSVGPPFTAWPVGPPFTAWPVGNPET